MKTNRLDHQLTHVGKEFNQFNQFLREMNRFAHIDSIELIGIQVCLHMIEQRIVNYSGQLTMLKSKMIEVPKAPAGKKTL